MAISVSASTTPFTHTFSLSPKTNQLLRIFTPKIQPFRPQIKRLLCRPKPILNFQNSHHQNPVLANSTSTRSSSNRVFDSIKDDDVLLSLKEPKPVKFVLWVLFWATLSIAVFAVSGDAEAAVDSIRASSFGFKVANKLRGLGWPDEAVVFALATVPVIELRGAIPVGYWLQLNPTVLTILSILGNMVPIPFIVLYLKPFASFLARTNKAGSRLLEVLFKRAKDKASPVEEFQWLGLMLFVAVPFPGTGAWTGAIIASVLDMPFWHAVTANFCGVILAGLLVNLLVNLGLKYAILTGIVLFFISMFMWSILRNFQKSMRSSK